MDNEKLLALMCFSETLDRDTKWLKDRIEFFNKSIIKKNYKDIECSEDTKDSIAGLKTSFEQTKKDINNMEKILKELEIIESN